MVLTIASLIIGNIDVGGGKVADATQHSLAQISLRWMVRQIVVSGCDIQFDDLALARNNIDIISFPVTSINAFPKELEDDKTDVTQALHDDLKTMSLWWILEVLPTQYAYQDGNGVWHQKWG